MKKTIILPGPDSTKFISQAKREGGVVSTPNSSHYVFKSKRTAPFVIDQNSTHYIFSSDKGSTLDHNQNSTFLIRQPKDEYKVGIVKCSYIMFREQENVLNVVGLFNKKDLQKLKEFILKTYNGWDMTVKVWSDIRNGKNRFGLNQATMEIFINGDGTLIVQNVNESELIDISFYDKEYNHIDGHYYLQREKTKRK